MIRETADGLILSIKVIPKSKLSRIEEWAQDQLKVRVQSPPEKGKANDELLFLLSERFHLPLSSIHLMTGQHSRQKTVKLCGITLQEFQQILSQNKAL